MHADWIAQGCAIDSSKLSWLCFSYIFVVLVATAVWVVIFRNRSFGFLARAMFFPAAASLPSLLLLSVLSSTCSVQELLFSFLRQGVFGMNGQVVAFSAVGVILEAAAVGLTVLLGLGLGWSHRAEQEPLPISSLHPHNRDWLSGFLRAAGEELGWRAFLLPLLIRAFDSFGIASAIVGVVWGLYHVPIMVLLSTKLRPRNPIATILVQFAHCFFFSFVYNWVAMQAGFSFLPPTIMHWFWNRLNPTVLGSIYTQSRGKFIGEQWLINGEGLAGTIVGICFSGIILL